MVNNIDNTKKIYVFRNFAAKVQIISKNPNFFDKKNREHFRIPDFFSWLNFEF